MAHEYDHDDIRYVDAPTARRFLVARHLLAPPRSLPTGPDGVRAAFASGSVPSSSTRSASPAATTTWCCTPASADYDSSLDR